MASRLDSIRDLEFEFLDTILLTPGDALTINDGWQRVYREAGLSEWDWLLSQGAVGGTINELWYSYWSMLHENGGSPMPMPDFLTVWTGGAFGSGMTLPDPYTVDSSNTTSWRSAKTGPGFTRNAGRYCFEVSMTADRTTSPAPGDDVMAGWHQGGGNLSNDNYLGFDPASWSVSTTGSIINNNTFGSGTLANWALATDTAMIMVDIDAGTMSYSVGSVVEQIFANLSVGVDTFPAIGALDNGITANWGELPFVNDLPSGYLPWNGAFS